MNSLTNISFRKKPIIIHGLLENQKAGQKWNFDYFKSTIGDLTVGYMIIVLKKDGSTYTSADMKMKFKDFLNIIEKSEHLDLRMFLFNLFKHSPELKKEFPYPVILKGLPSNIGLTFFAEKDTTIRIHYDIDMSNILHTQVLGHKRVILFSPEYNDLLYTLPLYTYSLVDIEKPNYKKHPGLRYVRGQECLLESGDPIFISGEYRHLMKYLDGGISMAYRKMASTLKVKLQAVLNLGLYLPADKLMGVLFPSKWKIFKNEVAEQRANRAMHNLDLLLKDQMTFVDINYEEELA